MESWHGRLVVDAFMRYLQHVDITGYPFVDGSCFSDKIDVIDVTLNVVITRRAMKYKRI